MVHVKGWLQLPSEPKEYIVVGRVYALTQHYVPRLRSSAACLSPNQCELCDQAMPVQQIALLPVKSRENPDHVWLLRLLPSQTSLINSLSSQGNSLIGKVIEVERAPGAQQKRPLIRPIGETAVNPPPLENYIRAIGKKAYARAVEIMLAQPELGEA